MRWSFPLAAATALWTASSSLAALTYKGVDWSSVTVEERAGIKYTDNGASGSLEQILKNNGVNSVRQRIWVNPSNGDYNLAYNLALARRAKAQGLSVYLTLHFSDTWADPAHQAIPRGWPSGVDDLSWRLYNYTLEVCNAFAKENLPPAIVSIGNEITAGLLFPTGSTSNYNNVARLLNSAAWGIKDSSLNPKPKIMIHLDKGWSWSVQQGFYQKVLAAGTLKTTDFDMMGVSYYPFYGSGATLSALRDTLGNMARTWGKEIVVAELDWPTSCPSPAQQFPSDLRDIPFSAEGQRTFIQRVAQATAATPGGVGIYYWEPAWMNNQALGSSCPSNTLFAWPGTSLSSLSVFKNI